MWVDQRGSEIIPLPECLRLLASAAKEGAVGRLAVSRREAPLVQPMNFAFADHRVLVRLGPGAMASAATDGLVAFEVDHLDRQAGEAWSVLVRGLAVVDADVSAEAPIPLVPSPGDVVLAIRLDVVTGRRFTLHAIPSQAAAPGDATDAPTATAGSTAPEGAGPGGSVSGGATRTPVP